MLPRPTFLFHPILGFSRPLTRAVSVLRQGCREKREG